MKYLKLTFMFLIFFSITVAISSCNNSSNKKIEQQGKEYTSAYICPMHCEGSGSDKAGTCPVCGMDYEKNENLKEEGQTHDHSDHNHSH